MTHHKSAFEFKINVSLVDGYFLAHKGGGNTSNAPLVPPLKPLRLCLLYKHVTFVKD